MHYSTCCSATGALMPAATARRRSPTASTSWSRRKRCGPSAASRRSPTNPLDDVALATRLHAGGFKVGFLRAGDALQVRMYRGAGATFRGWRRNFALFVAARPAAALAAVALPLATALWFFAALARRDILALGGCWIGAPWPPRRPAEARETTPLLELFPTRPPPARGDPGVGDARPSPRPRGPLAGPRHSDPETGRTSRASRALPGPPSNRRRGGGPRAQRGSGRAGPASLRSRP